jgi:hypothetical protein
MTCKSSFYRDSSLIDTRSVFIPDIFIDPCQALAVFRLSICFVARGQVVVCRLPTHRSNLP